MQGLVVGALPVELPIPQRGVFEQAGAGVAPVDFALAVPAAIAVEGELA